MPRGGSNGLVCAQKCPHFDVSKENHLENYMEFYKKYKSLKLLEGIIPSGRSLLISKLPNLKMVQYISKFCLSKHLF